MPITSLIQPSTTEIEVVLAAHPVPRALQGEYGDPGIELLRRLTSAPRHAARVDAARAVAEAWDATADPSPAITPWPADSYEATLVTAVVLAAESGGCYGGGLQNPGAGTSRIPGFNWLGKGRREASDGDAWTTAIREAFGRAREAFVAAGTATGSTPLPYDAYEADAFLAWVVAMGAVAPEAIASLGDGAAALRAAKVAYAGWAPAWDPTRETYPEAALALCRAVAARKQAAEDAARLTAEQPGIASAQAEPELHEWAVEHPEVLVTVEQAHLDGAGCRDGIRAWISERGGQPDGEISVAWLASWLSDTTVALVVRAARARAAQAVEVG